MKKIWVLVADEANARILEKSISGPLIELVQIRGRKSSENDDDPGVSRLRTRVSQAAADSERAPTPDLQRHHQSQAFAEKVALLLEENRDEGRFDELHLVAAPRMVGYLRPEMSPAVKFAIVRTLAEDLVQETREALTQRLFAADAA